MAVGEAVGVGSRREVELLERRSSRTGGRSACRRRPSGPAGSARRAGRRRGRGPGRRGTMPLPATWSSWLWLLTTASTGTGAPPRSTTVTDGSMSSASPSAAHEQRVARRVGAVGRTDEHADGVRQPSLVVAPVRGHRSNVPFTRPASVGDLRVGGGRICRARHSDDRKHSDGRRRRRLPWRGMSTVRPARTSVLVDVRARAGDDGDGLRRAVQHARRHPRRLRRHVDASSARSSAWASSPASSPRS